MPRLPRMFVEGCPAHVTLRGNDRQDIFRLDGDRLCFLRWLREAAGKHGLAVHAYVLMTNHVHMLATGDRPASFSKTVQSLGRRYVAYFNQRYQRTGTLWEGRYRSTIVHVDRYLFACHRYIDLNPVRAGLAVAPGDYPWSSHRYYTVGSPDDLVTPHQVVLGLGDDEQRRRSAYLALFDQPLDDGTLERIRFCSNRGWALGGPAFCQALQGHGVRRAEPMLRGWIRGRQRGKKL